MTEEAEVVLTEKERALIERVEKRFARHEGNPLMTALQEVALRYLLKRLKGVNG